MLITQVMISHDELIISGESESICYTNHVYIMYEVLMLRMISCYTHYVYMIVTK